MITTLLIDKRHGVFWFVMVLCQMATLCMLHVTGYFAHREAVVISLLEHIAYNIMFDSGCLSSI